jgi:hypothetical protein
MQEIVEGLWHWTAERERIHADVSSYYLLAERVLLDPMLPPGRTSWFTEQGSEPEHIVLTNRHHDRDAWRLREAFGCEVHCIANGCHELAGRGPVTPFEFGDELPGGIIACEIGAICPDETALHIPRYESLACADGIVRWPGVDGLTFVPDRLMDDPEDTKRALRDAYRALLELEFDRLLLAHGAPVASGAKRALRTFVA